ncbi:MAG: TetR/AcrR family transcriptional regulator [Bacteroidia bacterium]|jgi:AcrR family transcriptional regulator|nr:TetR/AcrR family transcriptional regulator [Bacteroidia bacterium]
MENNEKGTDDKILDAAYDIFLLYGYHGTTLQQIATIADTNKASIHYYFRSKERLYIYIVRRVLDNVFNDKFNINLIPERLEKPTWFLYTELYNNSSLFEKVLQELSPIDWSENLNDIKKWLESSSFQLNSSINNIKTYDNDLKK